MNIRIGGVNVLIAHDSLLGGLVVGTAAEEFTSARHFRHLHGEDEGN